MPLTRYPQNEDVCSRRQLGAGSRAYQGVSMANKHVRGALFRNFAFSALLLLSVGFAAKADTVDNFVYQSGSNTITWSLAPTLSVDSNDVYPGWGFGPVNASISENGGPAQSATLIFYNIWSDGGFDLQIGTDYLASTADLQLYTGPEFMPTFLLGTFSLTDWTDLVTNNLPAADYATGTNATLTVTAVSTPEPSVLTLLFVGLAVAFLVALKNISL